MIFATTALATLSLLVPFTAGMVVPKAEFDLSERDILDTREPHPFEIQDPESGYTLYSPYPSYSGAIGQFPFKALDGEQSSEYYVKVFLKSNKNGKRTKVATIPFDGYVASANVQVEFDDFPDGDYTLIVNEVNSKTGKLSTTAEQPFYVKITDVGPHSE